MKPAERNIISTKILVEVGKRVSLTKSLQRLSVGQKRVTLVHMYFDNMQGQLSSTDSNIIMHNKNAHGMGMCQETKCSR